jgi:hypothetical protein
MTFADGTELDASELDGGDVALELAGASRWGPTSLVALELDGPVAVVIVENDGVRYRVRARELEVRR